MWCLQRFHFYKGERGRQVFSTICSAKWPVLRNWFQLVDDMSVILKHFWLSEDILRIFLYQNSLKNSRKLNWWIEIVLYVGDGRGENCLAC